MKFDIYQGEKITVTSSNLHLEGQLQKRARYQVKLFRNDTLLLEWHLATILISNKVTIKYQNLPIEISEVFHRGLFKLVVWFGLNEIVVKMRPFKKAYYHIFYNEEKVAEVHFPKKFTMGYRQFLLETNSEDEEMNINIIIAFLLSLLPVL
jgi:hypothetical protein